MDVQSFEVHVINSKNCHQKLWYLFRFGTSFHLQICSTFLCPNWVLCSNTTATAPKSIQLTGFHPVSCVSSEPTSFHDFVTFLSTFRQRLCRSTHTTHPYSGYQNLKKNKVIVPLRQIVSSGTPHPPPSPGLITICTPALKYLMGRCSSFSWKLRHLSNGYH